MRQRAALQALMARHNPAASPQAPNTGGDEHASEEADTENQAPDEPINASPAAPR